MLLNIERSGGNYQKWFWYYFNIEFKTNESNLVTEIDKASEKLITAFIKKNYPTHGILAEEGGETKNSSEYLWVVDPLDGTTNFAHGLPIFSVSIGVQKNGKTIAGVVYDVMQDIVYSAEQGSGAFANGKKFPSVKMISLAEAFLLPVFLMMLPVILKIFLKYLKRLQKPQEGLEGSVLLQLISAM